MTTRTPATHEEALAVAAITSLVRYPGASWDKRFARGLNMEALTEKERPQVWRLFMRYRRQIHGRDVLVRGATYTLRGAVWATLLRMAEERAAPDFRKQQAAFRDEQRIEEMLREEDMRKAAGDGGAPIPTEH